jgi:uncharacterized protein
LIRLLVLLFAGTLLALDPNTLQHTGAVNDFAHVIDGATRAQLERFAINVEKKTGAALVFVTIDSLEQQPIEDFANRLYVAWGIGQKGKDEGALVLLAVRDKRSRIEIGRGLEPIITDGTSGSILREMRPALRENDFGDAMVLAAQRLAQRIAQEKGVSLADQEQPAARRERPPETGSIPWPVLLGGIFLLFWILGGIGRRGGRGGGGGGGFIPGLILGNLMGRGTSWGGGTYGGGGFGGYDSGDSFGGFGGGDSGGGGASSTW